MRSSIRRLTLCSVALLALSMPPTATAQVAVPGPVSFSPAATPKNDADVEALKAFFEESFESGVKLSPEFQTQLGRKTDYGLWNNGSEAYAKAMRDRAVATLEKLRKGWKVEKLPPALQVDVRVFAETQAERIAAYDWRLHDYPLNHLYGRHTGIPSFLINQHRIDTAADAEAYLQRLENVPYVIGQVLDNARAAETKGIIAPKFSLQKMLPDITNLIDGAPFAAGKPDHPILADFKKKLEKLSLPQAEKDRLIGRAETAMLEKFGPAYRDMAKMVEAQISLATDQDGVWKLPDGDAYYRFKVREETTIDISPDEVHRIGLEAVAKLQAEMMAIKEKVGFKGDLQAFFSHLRDDPKFIHPNTAEGKAAFIKQAEDYITAFKPKLDGLFITKPKADVIVKAVEPFRERTAPPAFYNRPAPDGSRPGIFYANLFNTKELPKWQIEAVVYHEAIPGHHMQSTIAQELTGVPTFRKFAFFTAYGEGWGLYSEMLPKELGFYQDPYSDFGRLNTQIWRAIRLVVDSGLHAKKWTRAQAIDYMVNNSPLSREVATREVDRYIVLPGQATSYYIGMLKILELRDRAAKALGPKFDIRAFHEVLLTGGAVPLTVLNDQVDAWIAGVKKG